ncbi:C2orf42 -like, partial [Asbolus verrucosus]
MNDLATHSVYTYLSSSSSEIPKILLDLGRPTKRGIKKCPKCGMYNGTRGMICKNKHCDAVFKDYADKRKVSLDAVRLTGIVRQVYSVRVRDRGPDHRGFVQLPLLPSHGNEEDKNVLSENALCFVDSCQRLFDDSILKCHELEQNNTSLLCAHIDSAIKSQNMATPIEFKKEILSSLKVSEEIKTKLWLLVTEKEGPLVQRVSRTVMAVKCQVSPKHPLGYLHFTFGCTKGKEVYDKYYCSCTEFMVSGIISKSSNVRFKCIHYYACICALASDSKCSEEFVHFINYELPARE